MSVTPKNFFIFVEMKICFLTFFITNKIRIKRITPGGNTYEVVI